MKKQALCKCTSCDQILINTNPSPGSRKYKTEKEYHKLETKGHTHVCPNCDTDQYLTDEVLEPIVSASIALYYSTQDRAYYMHIITGPAEQRLYFRITKSMAEDISIKNMLDILHTDLTAG
jgi:hypothetical protein